MRPLLGSLRLRRCSLRCEEVGVSHPLIHSARRSFTNICSVPGPELGTGDQDVDQTLPCLHTVGLLVPWGAWVEENPKG